MLPKEFRDDNFVRYAAECERLAAISRQHFVPLQARAGRTALFSHSVYQLLGLLTASALGNAAGAALLR